MTIGIAAGALIVSVLAYFNSLAATKQSIASDQRSQRAWLQIHEPRLNSKNGEAELDFALKNDGKTPAFNVVTEEWYTQDLVTTGTMISGGSTTTTDQAVSPTGEPVKPEEHQRQSHGVIAAGDTADMVWHPPKTLFGVVSLFGDGKGVLKLRFFGKTTYDDTFGVSHSTESCFEFDSSTSSVGTISEQRLRVCPTGNNAQ